MEKPPKNVNNVPKITQKTPKRCKKIYEQLQAAPFSCRNNHYEYMGIMHKPGSHIDSSIFTLHQPQKRLLDA